ncbi:MAG: deaminase [bacterium]
MNLKFFDLARKVSKLSDHKRFSLGAVIVNGSKIISVGTNKVKTHPKSTHPYNSLHAEMAAILAAKQDISKCELYVYRETKNGTRATSKPCIYCQVMINEAGIKTVYYSMNGSFETMAMRNS